MVAEISGVADGEGGPGVADVQHRPADAPAPLARPRRTRAQRLLLSLGIISSVLAITAAVTVGWAAWQLASVDRTDVALDELPDGGPANYLIVGSDTRSAGDPNDPGARDDRKPLADTIMVLRVDAGERRAKVLSLPRDLWVRQAGTDTSGRINAAYATGGPQRLVDTLQAELDIPIHHYVEVDFAGFQRVVSAVDGVPMWFDRAMRDQNSGLDVLHPGCTVLDGNGALAFARARHLEFYEDGGFDTDPTGDLGRISRQQLFLRRLIDRAKAKGIRHPLTLKRLVEAGTASVRIDDQLSVSDLLALGRRFASFRSDSLVNYTLPATPRTTDGGASVLDLDPVAAEPILDQFRDPPDPSDASGRATTQTTVDPADTRLEVLNSSGRQGLAGKVAEELAALGTDVDRWGNGAELDHPTETATTIRYSPGTTAAAVLLVAQVEGGAVLTEDNTLERGEVVLFLGDDFTGVGRRNAGSTTPTTTLDGNGGDRPTTSEQAKRSTTTSAPPPSKDVGMLPLGQPPADRECG